MCRFSSGRPPVNLFDVQIAAGLVGMTYPIGYAGAVQEILGVRLSKGDTLTDWRRRPLSASQVRYAYDDVRYLLPVHRKITERLKRHKRLEWAQEEFAASVRRAIEDDVTLEKWRKVKGIGALGVDVVEAREALEGPLRHRRRLGPIEVAQAALGVARLAWLARGRLPLADEVALREAGLRLTRAVEALDGCRPDADAERAAEEEAAAACEGLAVALGGDDRVVKMLRRAARALREG